VWPGSGLDGNTPLLVLGDLPLRCSGPQAVFVQTLHMTQGSRAASRLANAKYGIARAVFRFNQRRPHAFMVQTDTMKEALVRTYPDIRNKVHVIRQPVPAWLLDTKLKRTGRRGIRDTALDLFYPAAAYPHKNHGILSRIQEAGGEWPLNKLTLTISPAMHPNPRVRWIECVGLLPADEVIKAYRDTDALLFLSVAESYGLPLVEAMWIGLPIICPDLPYARELCGEGAIYFDPDHIQTLQAAVAELRARLSQGWWPDWSSRLASMPGDWKEVAQAMLQVLFGCTAGRAA
jgi:hypothetical protein